VCVYVCSHKHVIIDTASDEQGAQIDRKRQSNIYEIWRENSTDDTFADIAHFVRFSKTATNMTSTDINL
jgi:hypothetical protein